MNTISIKELHEKYNRLPSHEKIIDIRTPEEYAGGHIPHAVNYPLDRLMGKINELNSFKTVYLYCQSGGRVQAAYSALKGITQAHLVCVIGEGFPEWQASRYEIEF